jgi:capsular exopolysaccharide synthesis family protein
MTERNLHELYGSWLSRIRNGGGLIRTEQVNGEDMPAGEAKNGQSLRLKTKASDQSIVIMDEPFSAAAEQYRLVAAKLEAVQRSSGLKRIAVTSSLQGEGKTTTAVNLGYALAKDFGRRVLLVDGDFKKPSLSRYTGSGPGPGPGLTDVLAGTHQPDSVIWEGRHRQLHLLECGQVKGSPSRLWKSEITIKLLEVLGAQYDYLLLDTPPVLPLVDMSLIAEVVDGIVLVVRSGQTPKTAVQKAVMSLPSSKLVGTVLNGVAVSHTSYYYHTKG